MKTAKTCVALLVVVLQAFVVSAKDQNKHNEGKGSGKKHVQTKESAPAIKVEEKAKSTASAKITFSSQEREAIKTYIKSFEGDSKKGKSLPPGLQKKVERGGDLPPGWQKKVTVGEIMAAEVVKVAVPLPKDLIVKLPPAPIGTITVAIDGKVVRLMEKTREILDILEFP